MQENPQDFLKFENDKDIKKLIRDGKLKHNKNMLNKLSLFFLLLIQKSFCTRIKFKK